MTLVLTIWSLIFALHTAVYFAVEKASSWLIFLEMIAFPFLFGFLGAIIGYYLAGS